VTTENSKDAELEEERNKFAAAQVVAFMRVIEERFDLDEKRVKTLAQRAATNGKVYLTYSALVGILFSVVVYLYVRDTTRDDERFKAIEYRLGQISDRQIDVRERLRVLEETRKSAR